jgi:hypothetical protein
MVAGAVRSQAELMQGKGLRLLTELRLARREKRLLQRDKTHSQQLSERYLHTCLSVRPPACVSQVEKPWADFDRMLCQRSLHIIVWLFRVPLVVTNKPTAKCGLLRLLHECFSLYKRTIMITLATSHRRFRTLIRTFGRTPLDE